MKKHNGWKKTAAFVLSLALVAGAMPANVGGFLTGSTGIVAKADTAIPTNGSEASTVTKYVVGNVTSCSAEATGGIDTHDGGTESLFNGNGSDKLCCSFSGEMTIYFSYDSAFVPEKYYLRTAGDTASCSGRNMKYWKLQAKDFSGNWVDLDVEDNNNRNLLPNANNEAVGFELDTTTAYKDYRLTGIKTFDRGNGGKDCLFQLSEIYFENIEIGDNQVKTVLYTYENRSDTIKFTNQNTTQESDAITIYAPETREQDGRYSFLLSSGYNATVSSKNGAIIRSLVLTEGNYYTNRIDLTTANKGNVSTNGKTCTITDINDTTVTLRGKNSYKISVETVQISYDYIVDKKIVILTKVPAKEHTCETQGNTEYYVGDDGKYYVLENDKYVEVAENSWVLPATGHKWKYSSKTNNADGSLTVIFACENDGCNETYSVTFTPEQIEDISKIQGVTSKWEWAEDYSTATFTINPIPETMAALLATKLGIDQNLALYFASNGITVPATITQEETPATCTQNGTKTLIAHVNQLTDTKIVDDNEQPATGHEYGSPIWSWAQSNGKYTATMKAVCEKCGDVKTYKANVTSAIVDGIITYTATATIDGVNYTDTMEVAESYTFAVEGGTITKGEKENYSYGDAVTVKADAKQNNKYFSGWYIGDTCITTKQSYTFYVKSNMTVTARYDGDAVQEEKADIAVLITRDYLKDGKQKVVFSINWALPSGCKLKEAGIVRRYDSAENLTLDNVDGNEIKKNASVLRTQNGTCTFNMSIGATSVNRTKSINAVAYATYIDKNGQVQTVYSNVQTCNSNI